MASILESHPKRADIDEALMSGVPLREVVAKFDLPISHQAVWNYKSKVLIPAIQTARKLLESNPDSVKITQSSVDLARVTQQVSAATPYVGRLMDKQTRRASIQERAAAKDDFRAWAALDRNETADIRTEAELTGVLRQEPTTTIQVAVLMPASPAVPAPIAPAELAPEDVEIVE